MPVLLCMHGMHVVETLYLWPTLPIVVHYRGTPVRNLPVPDDEDNIKAK